MQHIGHKPEAQAKESTTPLRLRLRLVGHWLRSDALTDTTLPVYCSVNKRSQRAAWTVSERKDTVYETGIANPDRTGNVLAGTLQQRPHAAVDLGAD
jgi:hypothetical protein